MKILIFGSSGQLGKTLVTKLFKKKHFIVTPIDSNLCNFLEPNSIKSVILKASPHLIINCAAYTNVDEAERNSNKAFNINRDALNEIINSAKVFDCPLIHISTDYVFDGESDNGYDENSIKTPLSIYGQSKSEGEDILIANYNKHIILRTSWLVSKFSNSFVYKIFNLLLVKDNIDVVCDQFGKMTSVDWLASIILKIIDLINLKKFEYGIYNVACEGTTSWYEIADEIRKIIQVKSKKNVLINKISIKTLSLPAMRPKKTLLLTNKIEYATGLKAPNWKSELRKIIKELYA